MFSSKFVSVKPNSNLVFLCRLSRTRTVAAKDAHSCVREAREDAKSQARRRPLRHKPYRTRAFSRLISDFGAYLAPQSLHVLRCSAHPSALPPNIAALPT
eukprot:1038241-Rhodomonas_salina.3